jgi:Hemerythrin HHE cation binding domain
MRLRVGACGMTGRRQFADAPSPSDADAATAGFPRVLPANLIPLKSDPVGHLFADHVRVRIACDTLEALALHPAVGDLPAILWPFFSQDFVRHCDEEENDFMPMLQRRMADAGIFIDDLLMQLKTQHAAERGFLQAILPQLDNLSAGKEVSDLAGWRTAIKFFTESVRRDIEWEDKIIPALADSYLTPSDHNALAESMTRRRGGAADGREWHSLV